MIRTNKVLVASFIVLVYVLQRFPLFSWSYYIKSIYLDAIEPSLRLSSFPHGSRSLLPIFQKSSAVFLAIMYRFCSLSHVYLEECNIDSLYIPHYNVQGGSVKIELYGVVSKKFQHEHKLE